jgi:hypothetical protein
MAVEAAGMAEVAGLLLGNRLIVRDREIYLCCDLVRVLE